MLCGETKKTVFESCFALSYEKERDVMLNYFILRCTLLCLVSARFAIESTILCFQFLCFVTCVHFNTEFGSVVH